MIEAIVYVSKCGHTEKYAKELSEQLNLPRYTLAQAKKNLPKQCRILFMSWIMEDKLVGYEKALRYSIDRVVAVGILPATEERVYRVKEYNFLHTPLYYLPGGIQKKKLSFLKKLKLKWIENELSFKLLDHGLKKEETFALEAILHDLDYVDFSKLDPIIKYYLDDKKDYIS